MVRNEPVDGPELDGCGHMNLVACQFQSKVRDHFFTTPAPAAWQGPGEKLVRNSRLRSVMAHPSRITQTTEMKQDRPAAAPAAYERQPGESAKAYQAFTLYRDLPLEERSLTTVSQRLGKSRSLCARWSTQFRWVDRASAWDNHQDQMRRARRAAEREKMYERQLQGQSRDGASFTKCRFRSGQTHTVESGCFCRNANNGTRQACQLSRQSASRNLPR